MELAQHPFSNQEGKGVGNGEERKDFNKWKKEFWAEQARKALEEKGISCVKKQ